MNQNPLISIIVPVYNVENYLRECLDTVCNQTYKNLEIICVDDGSTDASLDILREYSRRDDRIVLLTQSNSGLAAARNAGLKVAKGEWVGAVDSDDYVSCALVEKCMLYATDDVDVVCFGMRRFSDADKRTLDAPYLERDFSGKQQITDVLIPKMLPYFCDKLWRRSLIEESGCLFPEGLIFEDFCFTRRVLSIANNAYCIPDKLYHYRRREGSIMNSVANHGDSRILDYIRISEICFAYWKEHNIRARFGYTGPSYLELQILNHCCEKITAWGKVDIQYQAWGHIRKLIEEYGLESGLPDFPDLALYYYVPPYAYNRLLTKAKKQMFLMSNERYIYWTYRRMQLMSVLTVGKRRIKYKEKKRKYHDLVRLCRRLKRQMRVLLHI